MNNDSITHLVPAGNCKYVVLVSMHITTTVTYILNVTTMEAVHGVWITRKVNYLHQFANPWTYPTSHLLLSLWIDRLSG